MPTNPRHNTSITVIMTLLLLFFFFIPTALPFHFNFPSFQQGTQNLRFQGDASSDMEGLQLTIVDPNADRTWRAGRTYYEKPMHLWDKSTGKLANFTTRFTFSIYNKDQHRAGDGLAFFLAQNGSLTENGISLLPQSSGANFGLFNNTPASRSTIFPTVAVEFDTYMNEWDPQVGGIGDHVGIDVNSIVSNATLVWPRSMKNGSTGSVVVSYSSVNNNLSVSLVFEDDPVDRTLRTLSYTLDLRDVLPEQVFVGFSAATGDYTESHTILSWDFDSSDLKVDQATPALAPALAPAPAPSRQRKGKVWKKIVTAFVVILSIAAVSVVLYLLWAMILRKRSKNQSLLDGGMIDSTLDEEFELDGGPKRFSYDDLAKATNGFSQNSLLGKGGFGSVYQGQLMDSSDTLAVAVKKLGKDSKQGKKEFASEVRVISRLRHRNLVKLIGWCHDKDELALVYQFMPNGSLDTHLFGTSEQEPITWANRLKIVRGLASALLYLHEECEQCVLHRDIKSSNVMLDSDFNTKLGDFGLARVIDHEQDGFGNQSSTLAGTSGYLAPECFFTFKATKESDIFSFGIVALEIACGRRPLEPERGPGEVVMVDWLWNLYNEDRVLEGVDWRLNGEFDMEQMVRLVLIGLWCAHPDLNHRPTIAQAISVLNGEAPLPVLPPKTIVTAYISRSSRSSTFASASTGLTGSDNAARSHSSSSNGGFR